MGGKVKVFGVLFWELTSNWGFASGPPPERYLQAEVVARYYKDLIAWQKSMDLVSALYDATESFPKRETYSLTDQMRRAAVSVPSNIAEGRAHYTDREFRHFLRRSRGSVAELETQVMIARQRNYLSESQASELLKRTDEVSRILSGLINSLGQQLPSSSI
jgi:four helix bundle protein